MPRFEVLVLLPLVLGFTPPGPKYGTIGSNNQGNNGQTPGLNMGSSGANVRMTVNNMNTGNPQQNRPNNNRPNRPNDLIPRPPYNSDIPYRESNVYCIYFSLFQWLLKLKFKANQKGTGLRHLAPGTDAYICNPLCEKL